MVDIGIGPMASTMSRWHSTSELIDRALNLSQKMIKINMSLQTGITKTSQVELRSLHF